MSGSQVFTCLVITLYTYVCVDAKNVSVVTQVGEFIGYQNNVTIDGTNVTISKFLGIPYAEPPTGNLRFQKPLAKGAFSEPLVVHEHGTECIQVNFYGITRPTSEDCLFLNIYVPENAPGNDDLAVMIFIHGGAFVIGSSNAYASDIIAARGRVIVVTINYRLSILGFLNVGDNGPSNFGLWDQHMAIKWVHDNIQSFGGDNGRVTIFGESAGAGSVIYHGIYPGNQGLFHRIIAQSGTAASQFAEALAPMADAMEFGAIVGCNQKMAGGLKACLQRVPAAVINETLNDFGNGLLRYPFPFVPSLDNEFIPISARTVLNPAINDYRTSRQRQMFAGLDLMMGVNSGEGASAISPFFGVNVNPEYFLPNRSYFEDILVPLCAKTEFGEDIASAVFESIINGYIPWNDPDNPRAIRVNYVDMYGDVQMFAPMVKTMDLHTRVSNKESYMYYFTATPSTHNVETPSWLDRPSHGEELLYVFGNVEEFSEFGPVSEFQDWEKVLSNAIIIMWSNFAKTGNPNIPRDPDVDWQPYTSTDHRYIEIGKYLNQTVTKERLYDQRMNLWNTVLPRIHAETSAKLCDPTTSGVSSFSSITCIGYSLVFIVVVLFKTW